MRGYDWDDCAPQGANNNNNATPMGQLTAPKGAQVNGLLYSSSGTNNYNNKFNNDDDDDRLIFLQSNMSNGILREDNNTHGRGFGSTVSETLPRPLPRPAPWPDFSTPPPNRPPPPQVTAPHCKPHFTIGMTTSPPPANDHPPSPAAAAPKGDKSTSGWASMTSSKVHENETHSHWDQSSVGKSQWFSMAFPEDFVRSKTPVQRSTTSASFPVDEDSDAMPDYTWDVYDLRREDQRREDQRREEERDACSSSLAASIYDPESPTDAGDEFPPTTNPGPEGLTESEMLCFLRLLNENYSGSSSSSSGSSIRYTIEQFVTCIPVTIDAETLRQRWTSMSSEGIEIYNCLLHIAPKATKPQVLNSMTLLPFILKSLLGQTALEWGDERRETPPEDESRSRSRSNQSSSSVRRHRGRSKSPPPPPPPEARRPYGSRSPIRGSHSSGLRRRGGRGRRSPKTRSGPDAPEWRIAGRGDRRHDLTTKIPEEGRRKQPRPSNGKATVRLDHLEVKEGEGEEGEEEAVNESRTLEERKWRRVLYFRKRSRQSAGGKPAGSGYVEPLNRGGRRTNSRLPLRQRLRPPPMPFYRRKSAGSAAPIEKICPLLDIDFSVPRFPPPRDQLFVPVAGKMTNRLSPPPSSSGREPPVGRGPLGGLLPDPGTVEYRAVIQRAVTTRLGSGSPPSMDAESEFSHSSKSVRQINNGKM